MKGVKKETAMGDVIGESTSDGKKSKKEKRSVGVPYFQLAVLRQNIAWFDGQSSGSLISQLSENIDNIEKGTGHKLGLFIQYLATFITGIVIGFVKGWKLTLVALATMPLILIAFGVFAFVMQKFSKMESVAYADAGAIAGEVLSAIRTVVAFGGEEQEHKRYVDKLGEAEKVGIKKSSAIGCGTIALGSAMPNLEFFAIARASAVPIFETIDRIPPIDKEAGGKQLPAVTGDIEFRNVSFIYESRPDVTIFINGTEIRQLDLFWYRSQLGVVQQEPVLFAGTVAENITMGYLNATREQIEEAAKLANAHEFIMKLPEGYDTWIAEGGGSMSGGQKQRIAIARALVRNPKIMLLDEATSALDTRSERQVQAALEKACSGRTVMMIAHRLTTVQNADCILVIEKGRVRESGTHRELLKAGGLYATMLRAQGKQDEVVEEEEEDDELYEKPSEDLILTTQYKALYSMKRMMRYSRPEVGFTIGGCIGAILAALVNPGFVLLYAEIFQASGFYAGMMVVLALGYLIGMAMEGIFFGFVGERLTRRLRDKMFGTILKQYRAFFDEAGAKGKKTERAQIAQECFIANRTVTTLSLEKYFSDKFVNTLEADKRAFSAVTFSLSATGRVVAFIPDMRRAIEAAKKILILLDRVSLIPKEDGFVPNELFDGRVVIKNIKFRYPTRIHVPVLRGFTHSVEANQTHALVGQSGCGKSTVLQLLLRFYDPVNAENQRAGIFLNGRNTVSLAPWWIRRQIGLVSQEPNLFNTSVRENISFGVNFREATMDEIIDAAKKANIHDFIMTLPEGYETSVGERGSKLSGGQKQRVAIARALIRQPQLLLLDEATSALDNESERLVQAALDEAMGQRTCLVIAHRLTTVEVADEIVVLDNGRLREKGTASELMAAKGAYYALHSMES
ncbi:Multidrug resistance protein 1 [Fasciola gigantica]|uniref:Multidrug resistance protein 1 n=1 Tax=Fasciola gigantica TaxID=46835 RepID=A0A504YIS6_FASGI|nr:Multidrug resistance protein 1 [Fasciola gigantica]